MITCEALGLCDEGGAEEPINNNDNTYGGKYAFNLSGGLMSKEHPLGATRLARCTELVWQLRVKRQVEGAKNYLQYNVGFGSACAVKMYQNNYNYSCKLIRN